MMNKNQLVSEYASLLLQQAHDQGSPNPYARALGGLEVAMRFCLENNTTTEEVFQDLERRIKDLTKLLSYGADKRAKELQNEE